MYLSQPGWRRQLSKHCISVQTVCSATTLPIQFVFWKIWALSARLMSQCLLTTEKCIYKKIIQGIIFRYRSNCRLKMCKNGLIFIHIRTTAIPLGSRDLGTKRRLSTYALVKILISHFWVPSCLCFKASLSAKPFLWKWFVWKWNSMQNSFSYESFRT